MTESRLLRMGISGQKGPQVTGGNGTTLKLDNGRAVLDAMTTPAPLGHRHPKVVEAVRSALDESPTLDEGWSTPARERAAEALIDTALAGEDWVGAVRFGLTGSEVNDLALSLCQALTDRQPLVTRERAYHGMVGLSRDVTVQPQWHGGLADSEGTVRSVPPSVEVRTLPFPRSTLGGGLSISTEQAREALAGSLEFLEGSAAVIIDYTQGGCYSTPAYQDVVADAASEAGALWVADEVITGFGKGGRWFNFQRGERRPDLVTLGKPMGGGLVPAAGIIVSKQVLDMIGSAGWQNYSALRSNDMAAAATSALIEVIDSEGLVDRADQLHEVIAEGMAQLLERHPSVDRIDGRGLHWWVDLHGSDWRQWTGSADGPSLAGAVAARVLDEGAMIATSGESHSVLITLPLVVSEEEIDLLLGALDEGLAVADAALDMRDGGSG